MTTMEILQHLELLSLNQPDKLNPDLWKDVSACMLAELDCRREYYPSQQYDLLADLFTAITSRASQSVKHNHSTEAYSAIAELKGILEGFPSVCEDNAYAQQALFDHAALHHYRKDTTIILGDSHVIFFSGADGIQYLPVGNGINYCPQQNDLPFSTLYLGSCLAYTSMKPDSTTAFYRKLLFLKEQFIKPNARIILSLGEIDLRSHVFKQSFIQKESYQKIIDNTLVNYRKLIVSLLSEGYRIYCWGPIGSQKDSIPNSPDYPRYGTEKERNEASIYFTDELRKICQQEGAALLSIIDQLVDHNMETRPEYLSSDHFHIGPQAMPLVIPLLKSNDLV